MSMLAQHQIGKKNYIFGLQWQPLSATESIVPQMKALQDGQQKLFGVLSGNQKINPAVGLLPAGKKLRGFSAAASLLQQENNVVIVHAFSDFDPSDNRYWICAIQDGNIVAGSDAVKPKADVVKLVKRFQKLGAFTIKGNDQFFQAHFPEWVPGVDFLPQSHKEFTQVLTQKPIRCQEIRTSNMWQNIGLAVSALAAAGLFVGHQWYQQYRADLQKPILDRLPQSTQKNWQNSYMRFKAASFSGYKDVLTPYTPQGVIESMLKLLGGQSAFIDDWALSNADCRVMPTVDLIQCALTWQNGGISTNQLLATRLGRSANLQFDVNGERAVSELQARITPDRPELTEDQLAMQATKAQFLYDAGSALQTLKTAGIKYQLRKAIQGPEMPTPPKGVRHTGPDYRYQFGRYTLAGSHYFVIEDVVKRLSPAYFSLDTLKIQFSNTQDAQFEISGHYVWK